MPKVGTDSELLAQVLALEEEVGNLSKIAVLLNVDRSTLWRFIRTGRAIERNREMIRSGLLRIKSETNVQTAQVNEATPFTLSASIHEDVRMLRSLCTTVLTVLDGYEKLLANRVDNN